MIEQTYIFALLCFNFRKHSSIRAALKFNIRIVCYHISFHVIFVSPNAVKVAQIAPFAPWGTRLANFEAQVRICLEIADKRTHGAFLHTFQNRSEHLIQLTNLPNIFFCHVCLILTMGSSVVMNFIKTIFRDCQPFILSNLSRKKFQYESFVDS